MSKKIGACAGVSPFGRNHAYDNEVTGHGRRRHNPILAALLLGASLASLAASPAFAATDTWTGGTSAKWSDTGNWSTASAPVTGDDVIIAQTGASSYTPSSQDISGLSLNSLTLNTAGTGTNSLTSGYVIGSAGDFLGLQSGGTITDNAVNGAADQIDTNLTLGGPATITVSSSATGLIINGAITGSGALTVDNQSVAGVQFLGTDTYTGTTTISAGILQIGNGGTSGSLVNTAGVIDSGSLVFDHSDAVTFYAPISGSGGVAQIGSGTLTLGNSNSYNGGTVVSAGTLAIQSSTSIGTGALALSGGATVKFLGAASLSNTAAIGSGGGIFDTNGYDVALSGTMSGSGGLTVAGGGILELGANDSYGGGTTINSGTTLSLGLLTGSSAGSISGAVTDNGTLEFNRTDNVAFSSVISGSGRVWKEQTNTLTLTGTDTYSGGTTIFDGTLQLGDGATAGAISGAVTLTSGSATLAFNEPGDLTFSNTITGTGGVSQEGGNTLTLTGDNVLGSLSISSGGTLQLGDGTNGSLTLTGGVTDNGTLNIDYGTDLSISGAITGSGALVQSGSGTTTLSGANTYGGGTTISGGTLQIGAGAASGSVSGDITDNATLAFNRSDSVTYSGVISGSGALQQLGTGTLILTGTNTYGGGTTISAGTLQIGDGSTTGAIGGDVTDNAILAFNRSDAVTFSGVISGFGSVEQDGSGTLRLSGSNTYSGDTNLNAGTLAVSSSDNLGSGAVGFTNGATLQFLADSSYGLGVSLGSGGGTFDTNGHTVTWSGAVSGASGDSLVKTGAGTLILAGANSYAGDTTVSAGTLQVGDGGTSGAITGNVTDNATLAFDYSSAIAYSGVISGSGVVEQAGSGTLTLSGTNTYTGGTAINAGTLAISSDANLGSGGTVALAAGTTLKTTATNTFAHDVTVTGDPTFFVATGTTTTWSGVIADGGSAGTVEIAGGGTFAPTAVNTYSGGTVVRDGSTLSVGADSELGATSGGLTLGDATTSGTLAVISPFTLDSGRSVTLAAGGGTINTAAAISFGISQGITGAGALTVAGPGTLVLTGTSSYSGGTTISAGTLQLGDGTTAGTIAGTVADNSALVFEEGSDTTFGGAISGTGTLTQNDSGHALILTGANTYSGGTTISAGTLQIGNGGTAGSIAGDIADSGTLAFDRSDTLVYSGVVSGSGSLAQTGAGTTVLTGANIYSGGTTISAGTLQIGNAGTSGSISGDVADGGTLAFDRTDAITFAGVISGTGSLSQTGPGTTTLTGANTYSGGTTISAGTLQIGDGGTSGAIAGDVTDNAKLAFDRSDTVTFAGVISGTGSLFQTGSGTTELTGANTYSGGTTISAGTLQIGNGGTAGAIAGNVTDNATLAFDHSNTVVFAGAISGTGALKQTGAGTTTLTGANTYSGGTTISAGTLQIGNGGTSGSLTGNVADGGTLAFDRTDSLTYAGVISGAGDLRQAGTGTTILTGISTYTGGTTISAGTLQIGDGGTSGAIAGNVTDNATLAFDRSSDMTFAGVISGTGGLVQAGNGTLTLTATNTYSGASTVENGTLLVNGSIAASSGTTVNGGATIAGTGTLSRLTVANNGTVAPGGSGSIGTLNVSGNLSLASGSVYAFDATSSSSDLLKVSGSAQLGGTLSASLSGTGFGSTPIPVLNAAGGLSGTFSNVSLVAGSPSNLQAYLSYDANNAYLVFMPTIVSLVPSSGPGTNQGQVASAIDFAIQHDNAGMAFQPLAPLSAADLAATLPQMTGEVATGVQTVAIGAADAFLGDLVDPSVGGRSGLGGGYAIADMQRGEQLAYNGPDGSIPYEYPDARRFSVWGSVQGGHDQSDGKTMIGTNRLSATQFGGEVGVNYTPYRGNGAIGLAVGYDKGDWNLAHELGKGSAKATEVGVYYSRLFGQNYFAAAFSYAHYDVTTERTLSFGGANLYHGSFTASSLSGRIEGGHTFTAGANLLTPYVRFQAIDLGLPNFKETTLSGSSAFALSYTRKQFFDYSSELGGTWSRAWNWPSGSRTELHARLGWLHDYAGEIANTVTFSAFSGASFLVKGAALAKDAAHVNLGFDHNVGNFALALNAESALSGTAQSYGGSLSVSYRW